MHIESGEHHGHTNHRGTRLVVLLACIGGLAGCAGSSQSSAPPATAQTEPEPNSVLEKDRQMAFSRESPAPDPENTPSNPQGAAAMPTPGVSPTLQPTRAESHTPTTSEDTSGLGQNAEGMPPADPAMLKQDQKAIDKAAATSERLADHTAAQTKNARDRTAVPAGTPKSTGTADKTPTADKAPAADKTDKANASDKHAADNTARNKRDQNDKSLTPIDQSNESSDLQLTAAVRRAIVGADGLSFTAKNVKIISTDGQVTLRGPVKSAAEKSQVEQVARQAAGAAPVVSKLEIEK
ncbi:MAG TPA: BON domain-containing protein [Polyangiales bacterium]|nr:BON domain-containing protein [Polyangiales bacterium]